MLAAGLPLGRFAWGGWHPDVLPPHLRRASLAAILFLLAAGWVILTRVGLIALEAPAGLVRSATWVFGLYFCLNTVMNLASRSRSERMVMTPVAAALAACFLTAALS